MKLLLIINILFVTACESSIDLSQEVVVPTPETPPLTAPPPPPTVVTQPCASHSLLGTFRSGNSGLTDNRYVLLENCNFDFTYDADAQINHPSGNYDMSPVVQINQDDSRQEIVCRVGYTTYNAPVYSGVSWIKCGDLTDSRLSVSLIKL